MKYANDLIKLLLDEAKDHTAAANSCPEEEELWHFHVKVAAILNTAALEVTKLVTK